MLPRWVGLMVVVVGLIGGRLPESAQALNQSLISVIEWSPDGTQIAVGYDDGRLEIRNANAQGIQFSLMGHTLGITTIAWNPAGTELASGSRDELFVWDALTGQSIQNLNLAYDFYPRTVDAISWNQDGSLIMAYYPGLSNDLQIWNPTTHQLFSQQQDDQVTDIRWSLDRNHVVASVLSGRILLKDPMTFTTLSTTDEPYAYAAAWSPGAQRIVSGSFGNDIRIWTVPVGVGRELPPLQNIITLRDSSSGATPGVTDMRGITFNLSGNRVYTLIGSGEFAAWDANNGAVISTTQLEDAPITAAAFNQLGTKLAYGDANGELHIVDVATLVPPETFGALPTFFRISDGQAASRLLQ